MLGLFSINLLSITTLSVIRQYSYRAFYITHVLVAFAIPLIIWFYVSYSRIFIAESLLVFVADLAVQKFGIVKSAAKSI